MAIIDLLLLKLPTWTMIMLLNSERRFSAASIITGHVDHTLHSAISLNNATAALFK